MCTINKQKKHAPILIEVQNVTKKYNNEVVLDNVSFSVCEGDYVGLIGPNGAGKSTLLQIILGLTKQTSGHVNWRNNNKRFGYVAQKYDIVGSVPISVREIFSMAQCGSFLHQTHEDVYIHALQSVSFEKNILNKTFQTLSGGQKQRVMIARALLYEPHIIFFDEPLSGVDYSTKQKIYTLLHKINQKRNIAILFVSHEVERVVEKCDHVLCLNKTLHTHCDPIAFSHNDVINHCSLLRKKI